MLALACLPESFPSSVQFVLGYLTVICLCSSTGSLHRQRQHHHRDLLQHPRLRQGRLCRPGLVSFFLFAASEPGSVLGPTWATTSNTSAGRQSGEEDLQPHTLWSDRSSGGMTSEWRHPSERVQPSSCCIRLLFILLKSLSAAVSALRLAYSTRGRLL